MVPSGRQARGDSSLCGTGTTPTRKLTGKTARGKVITIGGSQHDLAKAGIELRFAELKDPLKDRLKRCGLFGVCNRPLEAKIGLLETDFWVSSPILWGGWDLREPAILAEADFKSAARS